MIKNGSFRSKCIPFSQISNAILDDINLSLKSKGLYCIIQRYITIPNFTLYKSHLMSICCEGEKAFESTWKELKEKGYLKIYKCRDKETNTFYYEYDLLDESNISIPSIMNVDVNGEIINKKAKAECTKSPHPQNVDGGKGRGWEREVYNNTIDNNIINNNTNFLNPILSNHSKDNNINPSNSSNSFCYDEIRIDLMKQINYTLLKDEMPYEEMIDDIFEIMVEVIASKKEYFKISGENIPSFEFKKRIHKLGKEDIKLLLECFNQQKNTIHNFKAYLLKSLYNLPITSNAYYNNKVRVDGII